MKILVLTGVYWPDTASVAQHLNDLADAMAADGHEVQVYTSRFAYENPAVAYPPKEVHNGVQITRLRNTGFGKSSLFGRVMDFLTFNLLILWKLFAIRKKEYDLIFGMTVPPLVSYFGVIFARWKKIKFSFWAMDLQPELAIASGMIREGSFTARFLTTIGNHILRHSDSIITLDRYMKSHIVDRGAAARRVTVIPVWPVMSEIYTGKREDNPFRIENGFGDKIVIMYSGNHSYVHPLDTLLGSALDLKDDPRFLFVFIGGGVRKQDVAVFKEKHQLDNIVQLPYQPRNKIHLSLGSADLQVVILGENQVGFTHPNKIYGAMFIGKAILYIGPDKSHVTDILNDCQGNIRVRHGDTSGLTRQLLAFAGQDLETRDIIGAINLRYANQYFHPDVLKAQMLDAVASE